MKTHLILTVAAAALALSGCGDKAETPTETTTVAGGEMAPAPAPAPSQMLSSNSIAANLSAAPDYKSLATAVTQAGLSETLSGAGPFTVFAPTDAAFAQVPPVTRDGWMRPAQRPCRRLR